jgi:hypothetical protein
VVDQEERIIEIDILPGALVQRVGSRFGRQVLMVRRGSRDVCSESSLAIAPTRQEATRHTDPWESEVEQQEQSRHAENNGGSQTDHAGSWHGTNTGE